MSLPINVFMSVYQNAEFFPHAIDAILKWGGASKILLMEGAWNPKKPLRSTDGTVELIKDVSIKENIPVIWWNCIDYNQFRFESVSHRQFIEKALEHPYFHGPTMQQLLMARQMAMTVFQNSHEGDPGWYFLVDSDEVYLPEQLENLADFLDVAGKDHDFFTIQGLNFYFTGKHYKPEWYRRLFRIKSGAFFSDDNSIDTVKGPYTRTMNIPPEIAEFYHYCYIGQERVDKKLELWNEDAVNKWMNKFGGMLKGVEEYDGSDVHLFGDANPGYRNYKLLPFKGTHPGGIKL